MPAHALDDINQTDLTGLAWIDDTGGWPGDGGLDINSCLRTNVANCIRGASIDTFMAIRSWVNAGFGAWIDGGNLNWTSDGCSDRKIFTQPFDAPGRLRNDFGYRNWTSLCSDRGAVKSRIIAQLGVDSLNACTRRGGAGHARPVLNWPVLNSCAVHAAVVYAGVKKFGSLDTRGGSW